MIETIAGLKRTKYCGQFRKEDIGTQATVFGWVQKVGRGRNKMRAGLVFPLGLADCTFGRCFFRRGALGKKRNLSRALPASHKQFFKRALVHGIEGSL